MMDMAPVLAAAVGVALGFGSSSLSTLLVQRRESLGVRRQIRALMQAVIVQLGPACTKSSSIDEETSGEIFDQFQRRIFENDVAVAFNDKDLDRIFTFSIALRNVSNFVHQANAIMKSPADHDLAQRMLREIAITGLIAGIRCMNSSSDKDWIEPLMRNLAEDDPTRFGPKGPLDRPATESPG